MKKRVKAGPPAKLSAYQSQVLKAEIKKATKITADAKNEWYFAHISVWETMRLVGHMKRMFDWYNKNHQEGIDILVPKDVKVIAEDEDGYAAIAFRLENGKPVDVGFNIEWAPFKGFMNNEKEPLKLMKGQTIDRIGSPYGRFLTEEKNGSIVSYEGRMIPWYFPYKEVTDCPLFTKYKVAMDFDEDILKSDPLIAKWAEVNDYKYGYAVQIGPIAPCYGAVHHGEIPNQIYVEIGVEALIDTGYLEVAA